MAARIWQTRWKIASPSHPPHPLSRRHNSRCIIYGSPLASQILLYKYDFCLFSRWIQPQSDWLSDMNDLVSTSRHLLFVTSHSSLYSRVVFLVWLAVVVRVMCVIYTMSGAAVTLYTLSFFFLKGLWFGVFVFIRSTGCSDLVLVVLTKWVW